MGVFYPTEIKTTKHVALGQYYLLFTCPSCGAGGLSEHKLERREERSFTGLKELADPALEQSARQEEKATRAERDRAALTMGERVAAGDLSAVEKRVRCSRCGAVQPWSGMGRPWLRSLLAPLTALAGIAAFARLRMYAAHSAGNGGSPALACIPLGRRLLLSVGYVLRRKSRLAAVKRNPKTLPAYYRREDLRELAEGPYAQLVRPYLREGKTEE